MKGNLHAALAFVVVLASVVTWGLTRDTEPTTAAWADPAVLSATASSSTWGGGAPVYPGDPSISLGTTSWVLNNYGSSISACYTGQVTSTSTTPVAWKVVIDTAAAPWNGAMTGYNQQGDGYQWDYDVPSAGLIQISGGYSDNLKVSATQPRTIRFCNDTLQPVPATAGTVTVSTRQGTWNANTACLITTVTRSTATPWYYHWQVPLDISTALTRVSNGPKDVYQVRADGYPVTFTPALSATVSTYAVSSQVASSIKAGESYAFTTCAYRY